MIFGFPCNQFYNLEPLDGMDILESYKNKFNVSFPVSVKIDVNGESTDPLYSFLKDEALDEKLGSLKDKAVYYGLLEENHPQFLKGKELKWNYTKFLVAQNGDVIERYEPSITPKQISHRIEKHLGLK
jgi:glutathione peroxidase